MSQEVEQVVQLSVGPLELNTLLTADIVHLLLSVHFCEQCLLGSVGVRLGNPEVLFPRREERKRLGPIPLESGIRGGVSFFYLVCSFILSDGKLNATAVLRVFNSRPGK